MPFFYGLIAQVATDRIHDSRSNENQQFATALAVLARFEQVADDGNIAQQGDFGQRITVFFFINAADNQCTAVFNHCLSIQIFSLDTFGCFVFHTAVNRSVFIDFDIHDDLTVRRDIRGNNQA